jgi:RNA polymerase sigma-70 factor, ECF subfamily
LRQQTAIDSFGKTSGVCKKDAHFSLEALGDSRTLPVREETTRLVSPFSKNGAKSAGGGEFSVHFAVFSPSIYATGNLPQPCGTNRMGEWQFTTDDGRDVNEFTCLLAKHEQGVFLFILSLVPNWNDAEEIQQEVNIKLWQEFGKFQLGSDFGKWARTIARYQTLTFVKREQRERLRLSRQCVEAVAAKTAAVAEDDAGRSTMVAMCVEELGQFGRKLIQLHYGAGRKIRDIAADLKCTVDAANKALQRARLEIRQCLDRKQQEKDRT